MDEAKTETGTLPIDVCVQHARDILASQLPQLKDKGYDFAPPFRQMTIQLYLPRDASIEHVGTVFHRRAQDGSYERVRQMPFLPNSGYAFAVGTDTYHSADVLGPEVVTRDSIILTYYVDDTPWQIAQNRGRRVGNLLASWVGIR